MKKVLADYRKFNINPNDRNVDDCYIRSLSLAYGLPYTEVKNELNKMHRRSSTHAANSDYILELFIKNHGSESVYNVREDVTLEEFSGEHNEGTFIVFTGKTKKYSDHMVCVIDGDYWDSWDSSKQVVHKVFVINSNHSADKISNLTVSDISDELMEFTEKYLDKIHKKCPYFIFGLTRNRTNDLYMFSVKLTLTVQEELLPEGTARRYGRLNEWYVVSCKINPRMSAEANLADMKNRINVGFREFVYKYRKAVEDEARLSTIQFSPNIKCNNYRALLFLPDWTYPNIVQLYDEGENHIGFRYYFCMNPLPGDDDTSYVELNTDTLKDLKYALEVYKESYKRIDF